MIDKVTLDGAELRATLKMLKALDPDTAKELTRGLKTELKGVANDVASSLPTSPALSGLARYPGWQKAKGSVGVTPGKGKGGTTALVSIRVGMGQKRGIYLAELAGTRTTGYTPSGRALIQKLNSIKPIRGPSGRSIWPAFRLRASDISETAVRILDKYIGKLNAGSK